VSEQLLAAQREREAYVLRERKQEAQRVMSFLTKESELLKQDAHTAREQALLAEQQAHQGVDEEEALLAESEEAARALELLCLKREATLGQLTLTHADIQAEVERAQAKLDEVLHEGSLVVAEGENTLRKKTSEVRVLRADTGMAEARVAELRVMVQEQKAALATHIRTQLLEGK